MKISPYKVTKSNKVIQAKSAFSAMEHKIIIMALAQIKPSDEEFKMYRINIQDILGKEHTSNYELVRKSSKKLHKSVIQVESENEWHSYSFITHAHGKKGEPWVEIQFHRDIQHLLLGLKSQYTTYTLGNVINFRKNYSLRIYELCKQYQKIGQREMSIDYLRTLFSLEDKYRSFNLFKKYVIDSALEEINQHSDLYLKYEEIKRGRRIDKIRFIIRKNNLITDKFQLKTLDEIDMEQGLKERLMRVGFKCDEISDINERYTQSRISSVLGYFESHIDDIKYPKAWIEKTLQEFFDKSEYKIFVNQEKKSERNEKERKRIIDIKSREMQILEERIDRNKKDIQEYQDTGKLRPGDLQFRFKDRSVHEAIEELEERVIELEFELKKKEFELKKLLKDTVQTSFTETVDT